MPGAPAARVLRDAGCSAYCSTGLAIMGSVFLFPFYALEGVWECTGNRTGHVLPRLL